MNNIQLQLLKNIPWAVFFSFFLVINSTAQVVDGYTDKLSYRNGETVTFYLNGTAPNGDTLNLLALDGSSATVLPGFNSMIPQSPTTANPWVDGFGYATTNKWIVPDGLRSGYFEIPGIFPIPIIIKGDKSASDIVIVCSTNTDEAYCEAGNKSMYYTIPQDTTLFWKTPAKVVSFKRPLLLTTKPNYSDSRYMEGFLKWIYQTEYSVNVIADKDMDDYSEIENAKLLIVIGHSEYWTRQARINFDKFIDAGNDVIMLSGNSMGWQVRYQNDPNNPDNPQMVCYRGTTDPALYGGSITTDPDSNLLMKTVHWNEKALNYSVLRSIGVDWPYGGDGTLFYPHLNDYEYRGHKIILENSPLLNGTNLVKGEVIPFLTGEYDGTLINGFDSHGYPVLDTAGLGFYKAQLIGYDKAFYNSTDLSHPNYAPLIAFQKKATSGKVINVSSNNWCGTDNFKEGSLVEKVTQNMIDLLLMGSDIFTSVDTKPIVVYPNPNHGYFTLKLASEGNKNIIIYDFLGTIVYQINNTTDQKFIVDISQHHKGLYHAKVIVDNTVLVVNIVYE